MTVKPFSAQRRTSILDESQKKPLDMIIVGGGITGAGAFLEASRRGLNVLLLEKNDFASGTSSISSKLIHGGLRYLETFDWKLIFESSRERKRLLTLCPSLVHPIEFLIPVYKNQRRGLLTMYIGTWLYYLLSFFRNIGRPRLFSHKTSLQLESKLGGKDLTGSVTYFDASTIDSKLTLSTIKTGNHLGGLACNHANVIEYVMENGQVSGVVVRDELTQKTYTLKSKWVVNTLGPWTDPVRSTLLGKNNRTIRMTKGVHILLSGNPFSLAHAILMISPVDGRVVFLIPWCGNTLVGTTDTDYEGHPDDVRIEKKDLTYLLHTVRHFFPDIQISNDQILSSMAGLRCLKQENKSHPSDVSREHILYSEQPGLLTIAGGKLTTFLSMGEEIVDWIFERDSTLSDRSSGPLPIFEKTSDVPSQSIDQTYFEHLIEHEMACTIEDLLRYRTLSFYLSKDRGISLIELASRAISNKLGTSDELLQKQIEVYKSEITKTHVQL